MNTKNRVNQIAADQALADGLAKNAAILGTFGFGGKQLRPADVVQILQTRITAAQAATTAKANLNAAALAVLNEIANTRALVKAVKQALRALFVDDLTTLATFGLAPNKVPAPKPATMVAAATKAKATRAARGTKGPKARLAITVPAQADPVITPAAPVTPVPATKPQ
ncbi:MAG TPA: hypothetical protein VGL81_35550 [Polyangiaceae bacterium]|jgi:hypothetical protein